MSLLLLDLGNTRLKLAVSPRGDGDGVLALPHAEPGFGARLVQALERVGAVPAALLASVADPALAALVESALDARGVHVERVAVAQRPELRVCYDQPARFGVDRWLALLGARARAGALPQLVVSCGTALTVDLVDADGIHHGGLVAPSPALMSEALRARAPALPADGASGADFACDSATALASGCHGAAAALVERCLRQARLRLGEFPELVITGGGGPALLPLLATSGAQPSYHAWLVLDGLAVLARERAADRG